MMYRGKMVEKKKKDKTPAQSVEGSVLAIGAFAE